MRLVYVTTYDAGNIHAWSGTGYHMQVALRTSGLETVSVGGLRDTYSLLTKAKKFIYSRAFSMNYLRYMDMASVKSYAAQSDRKLQRLEHDVVFSPSSIAIALLRTQKPIVFWSDATFAGMVDFYPGFTRLCNETIRDGHALEQAALTKCSLALYSSEWAAATAIQHYDVDPAKVRVVPYGANIECVRTRAEVVRLSEAKPMNSCKLLFVGVEWHRKGGDVALEVAETLHRRGVATELHVVGCTPPRRTPSFVRVHGYVSKRTPNGVALLNRLFEESHFLILPSRAECCAMVLAEASSFGVPSLTTKVGGIPTAIRPGKNGQLFELNRDPGDYCDFIQQCMSSRAEYIGLAVSSFEEYCERLNWSVAGRTVRELIVGVVAGR